MASQHIQSVAVALENQAAGYANPTANGIPDAAGLTFRWLDCDRAFEISPGAAPVLAREEARDGWHQEQPQWDTALDAGGLPLQHREGSIALSGLARGVGDGSALDIADYDALPLMWLLESSLSTAANLIASAPGLNGIGANSFGVTLATNWLIGTAIGVDIGNRREYSIVTEQRTAPVPDEITHSPAFSAAITTNTLRLGHTLFADPTLAPGNSVALRLNGDSTRTYCMGCRWSSFELKLEGRLLKWTLTLDSPYIWDDHANADMATDSPRRAAGRPAHFGNVRSVVSSTASSSQATATDALARTEINIDDFSATFSASLAKRGWSSTGAKRSDSEVVDLTGEVNLVLSGNLASATADFRDEVRRHLLVGFGPTGAGNGICIALPAALLSEMPKQIGQSDIIMQSLKYVAGRWSGAADGPSATSAGRTPFQISFMK